MNTFELRSKFHALIDSFKNEELLERVYELLAGSSDQSGSGVWPTLTDAQRERVLKAYETSFDAHKLSSTAEVMKRAEE